MARCAAHWMYCLAICTFCIILIYFALVKLNVASFLFNSKIHYTCVRLMNGKSISLIAMFVALLCVVTVDSEEVMETLEIKHRKARL